MLERFCQAMIEIREIRAIEEGRMGAWEQPAQNTRRGSGGGRWWDRPATATEQTPSQPVGYDTRFYSPYVSRIDSVYGAAISSAPACPWRRTPE